MTNTKTEKATTAVPSSTAAAKGGGRSVNYPFITLDEAIKRARLLWDHVGKNLVPVATAAPFWGYAEKSSGLRSTVSALKQYGLLVDQGDGDKRQIKLSDRALDIVIEPPESKKREQAIKKAALSPKIYADILARFPESIPADSAITSYLLREKDLNRKTVDSFIVDLLANLKLANSSNTANMPLLKDGSAENGDEAKVKVGDYVQWESGGVLQFPQPRRVERLADAFAFVEGSPTGLPIGEVTVVAAPQQPPVTSSTVNPASARTEVLPHASVGTTASFKQDVYTLGSEGQVILQWPEKMSQESYDEFVDWIELQMRKIARLNALKTSEKKA